MRRTAVITFLTILGLQASAQIESAKSRRHSLGVGFPLSASWRRRAYAKDQSASQSGWKVSSFPSANFYSPGIDDYLPLQPLNGPNFNFKVDLAAPPHTTRYHILSSNSIQPDKPVQEPQEFVPPQSIGTAVIPPQPQPATPVNAAASNIPANRGAVFLGSGALGVVSLGNGAYALGSGSLGYSGNRAQPRPGTNFPVYPLPASPNLLPAATTSVLAPQPPVQGQFDFQVPNNVDFSHPFLTPGGVGQIPRIDANGYEFLTPNRVGFGQGAPRPPPRLRTTQQFATLSALQLQPQSAPQTQYSTIGAGYDFSTSIDHTRIPSFR